MMADFPFISNKPGPEGRYPVNLYLTPETERGSPALVKTPGLSSVLSLPGTGPVRAMLVKGVWLYAVFGNKLYRIAKDYGYEELGVLNFGSGPCFLIKNNTQVMAIDPPYGYVYTPGVGTFAKVADADFPLTSCITYVDKYAIATQQDSDRFWISDIANFTSWSGLMDGQVSGVADNIRGSVMQGRNIMFLGDESGEWFYDTGDADFPFSRIPGSFLDVGCASGASGVLCDNSVFWIDNHGRVCRSLGTSSYAVVSTPMLERKLSGYTLTDAFAYSIYWRGHAWAVFVFPTSDKTWVYDASTESWFQWSFGVDEGRHLSNCAVVFNGDQLIGDYREGILYQLSADVYQDAGTQIRWKRTAPPIINEGGWVRFPALQLDVMTGTGQVAGQGIDSAEGPIINLRWSDDDGRTWSSDHRASYGKIGEYQTRVKWYMLGASRNRIFEAWGSENTPMEIYKAYLEVA